MIYTEKQWKFHNWWLIKKIKKKNLGLPAPSFPLVPGYHPPSVASCCPELWCHYPTSLFCWGCCLCHTVGSENMGKACLVNIHHMTAWMYGLKFNWCAVKYTFWLFYSGAHLSFVFNSTDHNVKLLFLHWCQTYQ